MKLYLSIIGAAMALIGAVNIAFDTASAIYVVVAVILCTALQFALDGLIAIVINKLPDRLFGVDNPAYSVSEWEKRLYKKLKVRKWKDKVWELGGLGGFSKKKLADPNSPEYIASATRACSHTGFPIPQDFYLCLFSAMSARFLSRFPWRRSICF